MSFKEHFDLTHHTIIVRAIWDAEASVWVATSTDITGLATEAPTMEGLHRKVMAMVAELIELNGIESDLPDIPIQIMSEQLELIRNPHSN